MLSAHKLGPKGVEYYVSYAGRGTEGYWQMCIRDRVGTGRKVGGRELPDDELRARQPTRQLDMAAGKAVQNPDRVAGVGVEDGVIARLARRPPPLDHVTDQFGRVGRAMDPSVMGVGLSLIHI